MKKHSINAMKALSMLAILSLLIVVSNASRFETNTNEPVENPLIRLPTQSISSDLDLTELLNRHRVNLRNRFRVPGIRNIPRRCRHRFAVFPPRFTRFGPGIRVDPRDDLAWIMKKQGEVIRHQHVGRKFDPTVEIKRDADAVVYEVKEEYDGEWKAGRPHHHHHHHHHHHRTDDHDHHAHRFNHHGNYIMRKIRNFLSHF